MANLIMTTHDAQKDWLKTSPPLTLTAEDGRVFKITAWNVNAEWGRQDNHDNSLAHFKATLIQSQKAAPDKSCENCKYRRTQEVCSHRALGIFPREILDQKPCLGWSEKE